MSINFQPLTQSDLNYVQVIDLYKEAFAGAQRIPTALLRFKLRHGKPGFNVLYENENWIGLIYCTEYKDIVLVHFLAITAEFRADGFGSKVLASLRERHLEKRIVLNIEELDPLAENYPQRIKRKAFYQKNGFSSAGFLIKEPGEQHEMLILGGTITQAEIAAMYQSLFGSIIGFFIRPKIIKMAAEQLKHTEIK